MSLSLSAEGAFLLTRLKIDRWSRLFTSQKNLFLRLLDDGSKKSQTFRIKEEAQRWARGEEDARQSERDSGVTRVRLTLDDYFEKWMTDYAQYHHSLGWQGTDRLMYRKYVKAILGPRQLRDIRPIDIQRVLNEMRREGLAESYANRCRQMLSKMFNEAVSTYRYVGFNPVSAVRPFKELPKHIVTLAKEEATRLLHWADGQEFGLGIHLALCLGLREGEVCGLRWDAIDFEGRSLTVRRKFQKKVKLLEEYAKGKKIRTLGLFPDALRDRLRARWERHGGAGFVIRRPTGDMVTPGQMIHCLRKGIVATKISPVTFHGLRHTFASLYMQSGGDLYLLIPTLGDCN